MAEESDGINEGGLNMLVFLLKLGAVVLVWALAATLGVMAYQIYQEIKRDGF